VAVTWHQPHLLWLLLALPVCAAVIALGAVLRRRASARFGSEAAKMIVGRSSGLRATRAVLLVLGLGLAIVALARPQYGSRTKLLSKRGVDVVIALDFSKSMLAQDIRPSRIDRAKAEIARFISELVGDRVGVVAFAGDTMEFPMTTDYAAAALFFRELTPADMPVGGTAIGRALTASQRLLERSNKNEAELPPAERRAKVVVLMTDGEDHEGDPAAAAEELAKVGAKVFVIALGSKSGEPIPTYAEDGTWTGYMRGDDGQPVLSVLTPEAEKQLKAVVEKTGGAYFAPGRGSVGVDQIRKEIRGMKQVEMQARRVTVHEERYALALLIAFLLIVLEALLPEAWFKRPVAMAGALALLVLGSAGDVHAQSQKPAPAWLRSKNSDVERGNEKLTAGDADGALAAYDEAARALPSEGGVHLNRGLALLKQGKLDAARDALKLATDSSAGSPEVRSDAFYDLGISFYRQAEAAASEQNDEEAQKAFREASDAFRKAIRQKPGNADAAYNYELTQRRIVELEKKQQEKQEQEKQDQQNEDQEQQQNQDQQGQNQDPQNQEQQQNQDQKPGDQQQQTDQGKKEEPKKPEPKPDQGQQQQQQEQQEQQAQPGREPKDLPPDMAKALDALQQGEKNLEQQRAAQRAGGNNRRPPAKDW
jgi:Ca-activated chloride channel family protein